MTKQEYRRIYKNKRLAISKENKEDLDTAICSQLYDLNWTDVKYLHIYFPIQKFNEPNIIGFADYIRKKFPHIIFVISKSDFQTNTMINYLWNDTVFLVENKWGILEPQSGIILDDGLIDAVLIPLLVADIDGNRVGYGKGFYDRFLARCKATVQKIGISYFDPVTKIDDIGDWDVPIDILVTPYSTHVYI